MSDIAWRPSRVLAERTRVKRFMRIHGIRTVRQLHRRSVNDRDWFWNAVVEDLGVEWETPYHTVCDDRNGFPFAQWFVGGKLNIAHNCLDRHRVSRGDRVAIFWEGEDGKRVRVTYAELAATTDRVAKAMRFHGIGKGDVVGMCLSVSPEAVAVMFAAMKIGAVPMQIAARSSPAIVEELLRACGAKILFIHDGYPYGGKVVNLRVSFERARTLIPALEYIVLVPRLGLFPPSGDGRCVLWNQFLRWGQREGTVASQALDAEHRALILFSSGTTGRPKTIVHVHGGMLVNTAKELGYAFDVRENDVFFWWTNFGWMMAPWELIGVLFFGGSVVLYEGAAAHPTSHRLFEMIERYRVTHFGFSPAGLRTLSRDEDYARHDRSSLRILGSTGAPLDAATWQWFFETFGERRCPIINISGGTELMGCLVSPLPLMPQKPGSVGGPALGMDVTIFGEDGRPALRGTEGVLVCRKPFPSMTRGFLGEPERFLETYFQPWSGTWNHHDRAVIDEDGFWFLLGRDDDLINRGGVKIDPMAVEEAARSFPGPPGVADAVAVGVSDVRLGERIVCFIVLDGEREERLDAPAFFTALSRHIGSVYDPLGRPDEIYILPALPRTLSAKTPRKAYVRAYGGMLPEDASYTNAEAFAMIAAFCVQAPH